MVTKTSHLPIRYFLALLWAHPILHVSGIRVKVCFKVSLVVKIHVVQNLRFTHECCWWFRDSAVVCCVAGQAVTHVWKDYSAFILRTKRSECHDRFTLKLKALRSLEKWGAAHPVTQRRISEKPGGGGSYSDFWGMALHCSLVSLRAACFSEMFSPTHHNP